MGNQFAAEGHIPRGFKHKISYMEQEEEEDASKKRKEATDMEDEDANM